MATDPLIQECDPCREVPRQGSWIVVQNPSCSISKSLDQVTLILRRPTIRAKKEINIAGVNALAFFLCQNRQHLIIRPIQLEQKRSISTAQIDDVQSAMTETRRWLTR